MEYLVLGLVVAVNFIVIKIKLAKNRWEDSLFDFLLLITLMILFSGSFSGLIVSSIASLFISLYFFASPPQFFSGKDGLLQNFIQRTKRKKT